MRLVFMLIEILIWVIIIDAILTWIPSLDRRNPIVAGLRRITDPIYRPIRKLIPPQKTGYVDLSPLIAIIGLNVLRYILVALT